LKKDTIINEVIYKSFVDKIAQEFNVSYNAVGFHFKKIDDSGQNVSWFKSITIFLVFPIYLLFLLLKKNSKVYKSDVTFEDWRNDVEYDQNYRKIAEKLDKKVVKSRITLSNSPYTHDSLDSKNIQYMLNKNDYINKYVVVKTLLFIIKNINIAIQLFSLNMEYKKSYIHFFSIILRSIIINHSIIKYANTKVYVTAYDINAELLKYEIFKQYDVFFIIIQSSIRGTNLTKYKAADILYCYGENQKDIYMADNTSFKEVKCVGSTRNSNYLKSTNHNIKYDIFFPEQYVDFSHTTYASNQSYIKLLEHLILLSKEYPMLNIVYKTRNKRGSKKCISIYNEVLDKLDKSGIEICCDGNSYEMVRDSRLVIGYLSTLSFESIGIGTPSIFYYYDDFPIEVFDFKNSKNDILVLDSSYSAFKKAIFDSLDSDNHDAYFKKYKQIYMNQDQDIINTICDDILNLIKD